MDIGDIGTLVAIVGAGFSFVWSSNRISFFAGQVLTKLENNNKSSAEFQKAFEKHMEEEDRVSDAMWTKIDSHGDKIIEHGQRLNGVEKAIFK